jgi:hypothetical protein
VLALAEILNNLQPAPKVVSPPNFRPGVEFDGDLGTATTEGLPEQPNFDDFLAERGYSPEEYEIVGSPRTSQWQRYDGEWLTSYRFSFRKRSNALVDLPLLAAEARRKFRATKLPKPEPKCLVILWSDLQVGKVDYRGNSESLIERVAIMQARLIEMIKKQKPEKVIFADLGDTVENYNNAADMAQLQSNDLSIMEQVDLATTFAWQTIRMIAELVPDVTYASVGSNHCQWRVNKQVVGKPSDDWGIFIGRQLARLSHEVGLGVKFLEPQPHDESLAIDVFGDGFHVLGIVHGHQAKRPDMMGTWWRGQAFGRQPVADASLLIHGHWHHLRVTEMGSTPRGTSRFLVMAPTMDNGSGWWRKVTGEDSVPGLAVLMLEKGVDFTGMVTKL